MSPKVSVVIPAFNTETFIAHTIQSVFDQTYLDYEIIAVDDGSTDRTVEVLRRFVPRVKVLTKANAGPASARNLAIQNSTGEYIAFLDSDDLWVADKLEVQTAFLDRHPHIGLVFSEALMFSEEDRQRRIQSKIGFTANPTFSFLLLGNYIPNSSVVIRRDCVEKVGLLNESLIGTEDHEYWMRIARSFPIAGIPKPLVYYRIREGNLLGDGRNIDKGLDLTLAAIREVEKLFPKMWQECRIERDLLIARLYIRAGFAWRRRGDWINCMRKYMAALSYSIKPRVFRWLVAATILKRWS
jgi:glycosyltransferase involved in cell wall biosynthesis